MWLESIVEDVAWAFVGSVDGGTWLRNGVGGVAEGVSVLRRRAVEGEAVAGDIWLCRGSAAGGGWLWVWLEGVAKGVVQGVAGAWPQMSLSPLMVLYSQKYLNMFKLTILKILGRLTST